MIKNVLGINIQTSERRDVIKSAFATASRLSQKEAKERNSFPLRPSAALKPELDLYLDLVNYYNPGTIKTDPFDGRVATLLKSGHTLEPLIIETIEHAVDEVVETNVRVSYGKILDKDLKERELNGEFDFLVKSNGRNILCDAKTTAAFGFRAGVPKEDHVAQINLYMHSKYLKDKQCDVAWIVYYNKDNSDMKIYEFHYEEQLAIATIAKFQRVMDAYRASKPPAQEHFWGHHWKGKYSSYRSYLHDQYKTKMEHREEKEADLRAILCLDKKMQIKEFAKTYATSVVLEETSNEKYYLRLVPSKGLILTVVGASTLVRL